MREQVVLHVDLDCFYAAVAMRDRPELRDVPLVIGTDPRSGEGRGVALTANYVARRFGVRSAMPAGQVVRLCPQAVFVPPDWPRIREASDTVMDVLARYAGILEVVGIDEAYLDVTDRCRAEDGAVDWELVPSFARSLQAAVKRATGLSISVGAAAQRSLAKVASDFRKPHGVTVVPPARAQAFVAPLPVRKLPGCGPKTSALLLDHGVATVADLLAHPADDLRALLGSNADWLRLVAQGRDDRPVVAEHGERKSRSFDHTFPRDVRDPPAVLAAANGLLDDLLEDQRRDGRAFSTLTVKLRAPDFTTVTRAHTFPVPLDPASPQAGEFAHDATRRLLEPLLGRGWVRLVGVRLTNFTPATGQRPLAAYGLVAPVAAFLGARAGLQGLDGRHPVPTSLAAYGAA